jgi:osmoprotectant transport system ATP-binding protein
VVRLENVSKSYGGRPALRDINLEIDAGGTVALIGPSGCGKSTLLRTMIGLVRPDSGRVLVGGEALERGNLERVRHRIGYVIQDGGLFPHLTAEENVTLLARHLGEPRDAIAARVAALAELTALAPEVLGRYPVQLSGGQRQRVGLMRALMRDPPLLLLDEPLGALDPITRYELQEELKAIFTRLGKTVVLVTHDMGEAAYFSDDIVIMRDGAVVQRGDMSDLAQRPADAYVAQFLRAQRPPLGSAGG